MCVIIVARKGRPRPGRKAIANSWRQNSDGAGFCYFDNGQVHIVKGCMSLDVLEEELEKIKDINSSIIIHFRWATHGGVSRELTHPFQFRCGAIAHNGVITWAGRHASAKESDTSWWTENCLDRWPDLLRLSDEGEMHPMAKELVATNKFAVMYADGSVEVLGKWAIIGDDLDWWASTGAPLVDEAPVQQTQEYLSSGFGVDEYQLRLGFGAQPTTPAIGCKECTFYHHMGEPCTSCKEKSNFCRSNPCRFCEHDAKNAQEHPCFGCLSEHVNKSRWSAFKIIKEK